MDLSSPSPPSCGTDSDLVLDPADPFTFLLMDEWPDTQMKPYDMDFAVDPSALQCPSFGFEPSYLDDSAQFPFALPVHHGPRSPSDSSARRLSVSSSVSSSGASLSPAPEAHECGPVAHECGPAVSPASRDSGPAVSPASRDSGPAPGPASRDSGPPLDAAALIAERVRQNAGIMLALPITAQLQAFEAQQPGAASAAAIPKLPIPRLPRLPSSAAPTPPPSAAPTPSPPSGPQPRSKTSHTTIERRYRTNLNARIQSLRMAVPALRVLDDRDASKKRAPNKVLVSPDPLRSSTMGDDVVDERGFVDGVKVARKCSKANVLAKAVEYIRVLKKREARLKNEQAGLKSLISGLVGGPALLREWESEWRDIFGGEERDEVEGDADADDDDSEEEADDDDDGPRKRKRGKSSPSVVKKEKNLVPSPDGTVPEKRKRGRPRKVVPPPPPTVLPQHPQVQAPQQYLLATFALFSFFNSPLTSFSSSPSPSTVHVHTGTVLNPSTIPLVTHNSGAWRLSYWLQLFHLVVSAVVLVTCLSSWARVKLGPLASATKKRTPADWVRLAESYIFSSRTMHVPFLSRLQAYYRISSWAGAQPSDMCTAALVLYGCGAPPPIGVLARAKARSVWSRCAGSTLVERLVLGEMSLDQAAARLWAATHRDDETPMRVLGISLVRERVRAHLGALFVRCVCGDVNDGECESMEGERSQTVQAAQELGGVVGRIGRSVERVWGGAGAAREEEEEEEEDEIRALVDAVVLYRRVFGGCDAVSALISPPPRRERHRDADVGRLRRALGCRVFEESEALEDARDRAVDRVVELERRSVRLA